MRGTIRQRLTVSVVAATAVMLALLVVGFNVALRSSLDADANRVLEARAQAVLANVSVEDGQFSRSEGPDEGAPDALIWVFDSGVPVEQPQVGGKLDAIASSMAKTGDRTREDGATDTRLYSAPVLNDGKQVGTVVSGVSLDPYERTAKRSAIASVILGLIMIALIAVTTMLVVNRALKPVARMTAKAANWSEHDLDRRFNEGVPNDELSSLAATFDTMLDRMAHLVRHERNFSAELSHELRTPLSAIAAEAEIALRRERNPHEYRDSLGRISERSVELKKVLETLLDVARSESGNVGVESTDVHLAMNLAAESSSQVASGYGVDVKHIERGDSVQAQVGPETLRRILAPVLDNALAYASSTVVTSVSEKNRVVRIIVMDDGPGFDPDEIDTLFEPGKSGSAKRNEAAPAGTGLGLSLARRLAQANGGDVQVDREHPEVGASVMITLPKATGSTDRPNGDLGT